VSESLPPAFDIVVVNWNSRDDTARCLRSLRAQTFARFSIIVVDNGSDDGSEEMLRTEFPEVLTIATGRNLGFAGGCNAGISVSHAPWVVLLNNDTVVEPNWAEALFRAIDAAPDDVGMLQCLMLYASRPTIINSTGIEILRSGHGRDRLEGQSHRDLLSAVEIFCPTGGAAAYRRSMLDGLRIDGAWLDEHHFMYYEDLDLGWRAQLAGFRAMLVPDAVVHHAWKGSSHRHGDRWLRVVAKHNRLRTLLKNASLPFLLSTGWDSIEEIAELAWYGRIAALAALPKLMLHALSARRAVSRFTRVSRREVERRWVVSNKD
jgi:GT2 family glycosyltransferase